MIFTSSRKNSRVGPLLARISTTDTQPSVKGGRQHDTIVRRFPDDRGQAMAEYAFVLVMVAGAVIVVYQLFGEHVASLYERMLTAFT